MQRQLAQIEKMASLITVVVRQLLDLDACQTWLCASIDDAGRGSMQLDGGLDKTRLFQQDSAGGKEAEG